MMSVERKKERKISFDECRKKERKKNWGMMSVERSDPIFLSFFLSFFLSLSLRKLIRKKERKIGV